MPKWKKFHGTDLVDAWNLVQPGNVGVMVCHHGTESACGGFNLSFEVLDGVQQGGENVGMMAGEKAFDGAMELIGLVFERSTSAQFDFSERDIRLAGDKEFHKISPRDAKEIGYDGVNFDIGALEGFVDASSEISDRSHIALTHPPKLTPLASILGQKKASPEQTVSEQTGKPLRVGNIGLASGDILDMTGIDKDELQVPFKDVVYRMPVNAGTLNGRDGTLMSGEPVSEVEKVVGESPKLLDLADRLSVLVGIEQAGRDVILVDVKSAANGVDNGKNLGIICLGHGCSPNH